MTIIYFFLFYSLKPSIDTVASPPPPPVPVLFPSLVVFPPQERNHQLFGASCVISDTLIGVGAPSIDLSSFNFASSYWFRAGPGSDLVTTLSSPASQTPVPPATDMSPGSLYGGLLTTFRPTSGAGAGLDSLVLSNEVDSRIDLQLGGMHVLPQIAPKIMSSTLLTVRTTEELSSSSQDEVAYSVDSDGDWVLAGSWCVDYLLFKSLCPSVIFRVTDICIQWISGSIALEPTRVADLTFSNGTAPRYRRSKHFI